MKKLTTRWVTVLLVLIMALGMTLAVSAEGQQEDGSSYPSKPMEFIAPGGAGGGWDLTIRTVSKVLQDTELSPVPTPVTNKPGGGGGVTLSYLQSHEGDNRIISVYSPPLILINLNGSSKFSYKDTTPLARLIQDYGAFVVPKDSKYKSIKDVIAALKKDPTSVKIGGNSAVGSMDHIQFLLVAKQAGVKNVKDIPYISFQGGEAPAQLLGGHVDMLSTGLGDVRSLLESGDIRALAHTAEQRVGSGWMGEIPTCKEEGVDATFYNWRGLFGPPDMPEYAVEFWRDKLAAMVETEEWDAAAKRNGWDKAYLDAPEFQAFLDDVNEQYKGILSEIGMLKQ